MKHRATLRVHPSPSLLLLSLTALAAGCGNGGETSRAFGDGFRDGLRVVSSDTGSSRATVDGAGAIVALQGGAEVSIPADALSAAVEIVVEQSGGGFPVVGVDDVERVYAFLPHGTAFDVPVTIRVPYAGDLTDGLALYTSDPGGDWIDVPGATFEAGFATAEVMHFSFFFAHEGIAPSDLNPPDGSGGAGSGGSGSGGAGSGGSGSGGAGSGGSGAGGAGSGGAGSGGAGSGGAGSGGQGGDGSGGQSSGGQGGSGAGGQSSGGSGGTPDAGGSPDAGASGGGVDAGGSESVDAGAADPCAGELELYDGNLFISAQETVAALGCLRQITGSLQIAQNCGVTQVQLPRLDSIGGDLYLYYSELQNVELPLLASVGGDVFLVENGALSNLDLSALDDVGGALTLVSNTALSQLDLPLLASVGGDVNVQGNCQLEVLDTSALAAVDGSVFVNENPVLAALSLGELALIGVELGIRRNVALETLDLSGLVQVDGQFAEAPALRIQDNPTLAALALPELSSLGTTLEVGGNCSMSSFSAPAVAGVGGGLVSVTDNLILPQADLDAFDARLDQIQYFGTRDLSTGSCGFTEFASCTPIFGSCGGPF